MDKKKNPELRLLQELVELDALECPMILLEEDNDGSTTSNCPRGHEHCLCKGQGDVIHVRVPGEA